MTPAAAKPRPAILVVDDEPQILMALRDLLEDAFVVLTAQEGPRALEILSDQEVAVLVTDQRMPGMTGDQLLARAAQVSRATRVLLTGYADHAALVKAVNGGQIYAYVAKPWDPVGLRVTVARAAEHYLLVKELQYERYLLRQLMDSSPDLIFFKDHQGLFTRANRALAALLGLGEPEEVVGREASQLPRQEMARLLESGDRPVLEGRAEVHHGIDRVGLPGGAGGWYSVTRVPLRGERGEVTGIVGIGRDITELKRSEERLAEQVRQWEAVALLGREALAGVGLDELARLAAERVVETLGVDSCHLFRPDPGGGELVLMVGAGWSEAQVGAVLAGGAGSPAGYALARQEIVVSDCLADENRFALPGRYRERGLTSAAVLPVMGDPAPYGVLEACRRDRPFRPEELWFLEALVQVLSLAVRRRQADEALRRSQEQLRQAQKMEAIGRLAGGVAHDFNNLLNVIEGTCELLLEDPTAGPLRRDLETIQVATRRGTELTRQLLAFSRRQDHRPQVVDLNQTVRAGEHLLQRLIGAHIDIRAELHPQPVLVHADPGHLDQVLMNLVVNARDAMPSGGRLVLETCPLDLSEPRGPVPPGAWVRLSVSDTGCGMDEETASRIFEPFFTTKEAGKGTGLGLSIVYGLVQQSGGHIEVDSRPGQGTRFHLYFPRVEAPPPV